jgi:DNA-binding NtrC family response regulator
MLSTARVLVVGGVEPRLHALHLLLTSAGHTVACEGRVEDAAQRVGRGDADVVLLVGDALASIDQLAATTCGAATTFIGVASAISSTQACAALRAGASEVIDLAGSEHMLLAAIERAMRDRQLRCELAMLRARVGDAAQRALVGRSSAIARVRELVGRAAASRLPVLVTGEAGVGKDVVARLIHDASERAARPLITIRCTGASADALERELFGPAGAGTHAGVLEEARGGTIVLDDATALPVALREQLARTATSRTLRRVERHDTLAADARLVCVARDDRSESGAASIEHLRACLNAIVIDVPPLRERRSDIPQLVQHFRRSLAADSGLELAPLAPEEMLPLLGREWPGNVRELEHWVEHHALATRPAPPRAETDALRGVDLGPSHATLEQLERAYIKHVLALESGHQSRTAARLGIDRRTLYRKLKQYRSE